MIRETRTFGPDEIAPAFSATFRPSLRHRIKSALVAFCWLPGWLHVRWLHQTRGELLSHYFPLPAEPRDV